MRQNLPSMRRIWIAIANMPNSTAAAIVTIIPHLIVAAWPRITAAVSSALSAGDGGGKNLARPTKPVTISSRQPIPLKPRKFVDRPVHGTTSENPATSTA
jgi:hypothetical protein